MLRMQYVLSSRVWHLARSRASSTSELCLVRAVGVGLPTSSTAPAIGLTGH